MATLAELHTKAGNPDLSHWKTRKAYSVQDAALLTAGIDPLDYYRLYGEDLINTLKSHEFSNLLSDKSTNWRWVITIIKGMSESICTGELKCQNVTVIRENNYDCWEEKIEQIDLDISLSDSIIAHKTAITKKEHYKWLLNNGFIFEAPSKGLIARGGFVASKPVQTIIVPSINVPLIATPAYTTPALDVVNAVVNQFWVGFDCETMTPPKQDTVIAWIKENYSHISSKQMQEAIDKICRHPSAKTGGVKPLRTIKDVTPQKQY